MRLFDSHCHIDDPVFDDDFEAMLTRADEAGVHAMMIAGVTLATSERSIELAKGRNNLFTAVGIHPHDAKDCSGETIKTLKLLAENPCVRAWGEVGLDFNRMHSPKKDQEQCLEAQMAAADELGLPLIFHERDSEGRFLEMLESFSFKENRGVVHCFSGTKAEMFRYLDLGFHIGITGILTIQQRGERLRELATMIPRDRILIETDAPYLTPAPKKNKVRRNEPAFVRHVMERLALIREEDVEALSATVWETTCKLYNVDL
ncbi:MAG: TatD family hydrolase [Desulfobacteraceae bacterium]|nr:TatD family hydrolase [Desulfobacteraceae bacterium]